MCPKGESGSSHFQPGEGPSRGLLRDYEPSDGPSFESLVFSAFSKQCQFTDRDKNLETLFLKVTIDGAHYFYI